MKKLISDQRSNFKGNIYGNANEKIKIISDHGNIAIVEIETGARFGVLYSNIAEVPDEEIKEKPPEIAQVKTVEKIKVPAKAVQQKAKKVIPQQQNLFSV